MVTPDPQTRESIAHDLRTLGLRSGQIVLVHSSLRSVGWVCGGARAMVMALLDVLGPTGTLVVPSQTPENRDPSRWSAPAVPEAWWPAIRESLPAYDPHTSSALAMGLVAETVRTWPGAVRSPHPQTSFAAVGSRAVDLMSRHDLDSELGEASPLAAIEAAGGWTLLLGVGYDRCTALHLSEYRVPEPPARDNACVVRTPRGRAWVAYRGLDFDTSQFVELGADFERRTGLVSIGAVGRARARLLPIADLVRFAVTRLAAGRPAQVRDVEGVRYGATRDRVRPVGWDASRD